MGRKVKLGKQRKDKFYKLAKETGYRSRASFKLIQLNRKFEFLQKSRVLVDLCAAPGGWLQVAQKSMPLSSVVIGVDLVSIKPIPNVITLQEDITTDKCRQALKKQLKTWKADTILHDGAPNVGKNWALDAYAQIQLTLSALKLATEMLVKGGWFVTKVFRSKDYNSLIWVFEKLFKKVHVTKPQASRNESAEIFVVCQGYIAPDRIDPRFLDSSFLFKDVDDKSEAKPNILQTTKSKPKAEGYENGDASVFSKLKASDFIFSDNYMELLSRTSEIIFDDNDIKDHRTTTKEITECCKDIKVLGKSELRILLNWRKNLHAAVKDQEKKDDSSVEKIPEHPNTEEQEIEDAIKEAEDIEVLKYQELKKKKKKVLKERRQLHEKMNLKMIIKDDEPIIQEDRELFNFSLLKNKTDLTKLEDEADLTFNMDPESVEDEEQTKQFRSSYVAYNRHEEHEAWNKGDSDNAVEDSDSDEEKEIEFESDDDEDAVASLENEDEEDEKNPLLVPLVDNKTHLKDTVSKWFDKDDFNDIADDNDLEMELLAQNVEAKKLSKSVIKPKEDVETIPFEPASLSNEELEANECEDTENISTNKDISVQKPKKRKRVVLDPEGLALGALMIRSKKVKRDIRDNAYNRFSSNDEGLPDWFIKDEEKHNRKQLPVSAEMVEEYKEQLREINTRPIKKVIEAKSRKKRKAMKRMEKARKRAEVITDNLDMSHKEKVEQLKSIYKKAQPKNKKKDNHVEYVVGKKKFGGKVSRPAGVKGRYKVVDKRMRKDDRKRKDELKNKGKQKKGKHQKKTFQQKGRKKRT